MKETNDSASIRLNPAPPDGQAKLGALRVHRFEYGAVVRPFVAKIREISLGSTH